jgi:hypothetical protein
MTRAERQWQESGVEPMSRKQQNMLNAACDDLSKQMHWHGRRLSKDSWRHFFAGTVLGYQALPAWNHGDGREGVIYVARSSLDLSKTQATDAITMAFFLGDFPHEQGIKARAVRWCEVIVKARYIVEDAAA